MRFAMRWLRMYRATRPTGNWSPAFADRDVDLPAFLPRPPLPLPDMLAEVVCVSAARRRSEKKGTVTFAPVT